jgi:hypothetical protein
MYAVTEFDNCSMCLAGSYCTGGSVTGNPVMTVCPAGTYCPDGAKNFTTCAAGEFIL